jgi:hypothetical protein
LSTADEPPAEQTNGENFIVEAMGQWERWVATLLGLILGSLGALAVFTTSNQAGSAFLLLVGAAFLLIGVQGTPLIKIGGNTANLELERRRRRVERAIEQAQSETNPEVAQGMIEAATIIEPELALSPHTQALLYEDRVGAALSENFEDVRREPPPDRFDFVIKMPMGQTAVEVKYKRAGTFRARDVAKIVHRRSEKSNKLVIVTNAPLAVEVRTINAAQVYDGTPVEVVTWNDAAHDGLLQRAIARGAG